MHHGCGLQKSRQKNQIFLRCVRADLDLIMHAEHVAEIFRIGRILYYERSRCHAVSIHPTPCLEDVGKIELHHQILKICVAVCLSGV